MMPNQTSGLSRTVLRRAALAAVTAAAVTVTGLGLESALGPDVRNPEPVAVGTPVQTEAEALTVARKSGKQVEVLGMRTERREILAAPDGTFTAREYTEPVHAIQGGTWVDVDKTLVKRKDGSVAPKATTVGLVFSGGEAGKPFVTMRRGTHEMALTWPYGKLTAPVLDGDTATYTDALPGVDLKVRAESDGFGHLLVVKTKEAAADPRLNRLDLGLKTKGLTYKKDATGALTAEDSTVGGTVFQSGRATMWDSAGVVEDAARKKGPKAVAESLAAARADAPVAKSAPQAPQPALSGPGGGGKAADIGVELSKDKLTLVPDQKLLQDGATVFPVVIDPIERTVNRSSWTAVMSGKPTTGEHLYAGSAGVGKCPTNYSAKSCDGVGVRRVMYQMPLSFYKGKQILGATFSARVEHVYWTDATAEPIQLFRVGDKDSRVVAGSNWSNSVSAWSKHLGTVNEKIQPTSCGSQANLHFKSEANGALANDIRSALNNDWDSMILGLKAQDESDFPGWKRVCGNSYLSMSYNNLPGKIQPAQMSSNPGGACVVGAGRPFTDSAPRLEAIANDRDHGSGQTDQVAVRFTVRYIEGGVGKQYTYTTPYKAPTSTTRFSHDARPTLPEGITNWSVATHDGDGWGPESGFCEFVIDKTFPGPPKVGSAQYPSDTTYHDGVGTPGSFTFSPNPNDNVPDTDVVEYGYSFDGVPEKKVANATAGGPATVSWTPASAGPHWVEVQAYDRAKHPSARARYNFYVSAGAPVAAQWNLSDALGSTVAKDEQEKYPASYGSGVTLGVDGPGGEIDPAARFDGTANAYADASSTVLDTAKSFSVSAWVKPSNLGRDLTVVSQDGVGEPGFVLGYDAVAKTWQFTTPSSDVEPLGEWKALATGVTPVKDQWVLLTGVYDSKTGKQQLYVGTELKGEVQRRSPWNSFGPLQIGRNIAKTGYENAFEGALAQIRVFDRVIGPGQIAEIAKVKPERKGYWQLDAATAGVSPETGGGTGLTLKDNAAIYQQSQDDIFSTAALVGVGHLKLDGDGDYASTPTAPVTGAASFTLSARVQPASSDSPTSQTVFSIPGKATNRVQVRYQATTRQWELAVATADVAGATVKVYRDDRTLPDTSDAGQHLAVVYDAFAGRIQLYVNGQQAAAASGLDGTVWAATGGLQVGRSALGGAEYFAGVIDEVRAYNGAVDQVAIMQLANPIALPDK